MTVVVVARLHVQGAGCQRGTHATIGMTEASRLGIRRCSHIIGIRHLSMTTHQSAGHRIVRIEGAVEQHLRLNREGHCEWADVRIAIHILKGVLIGCR